MRHLTLRTACFAGVDAGPLDALRYCIAVPVDSARYLPCFQKAGKVGVLVSEAIRRFSSRYVARKLSHLAHAFGCMGIGNEVENQHSFFSIVALVIGYDPLVGKSRESRESVLGFGNFERSENNGSGFSVVAVPVVDLCGVFFEYLHSLLPSSLYLTTPSVIDVLEDVKSVWGIYLKNIEEAA